MNEEDSNQQGNLSQWFCSKPAIFFSEECDIVLVVTVVLPGGDFLRMWEGVRERWGYPPRFGVVHWGLRRSDPLSSDSMFSKKT